MNKWIVDAKAFEYEKHYSECKKSNQPFIKARIDRQTGNYLVFLDLATCNFFLSEKDQEKLESIFESEARGKCSTDKENCTFDGIEPKNLERFLSQIFEITQQYQNPK